MLVAIHLNDCVKTFFECFAIGRKSDYCEDYVCVCAVIVGSADLEYFGRVAGVDVVAGGRSCVAGEDGEVVAGDSER